MSTQGWLKLYYRDEKKVMRAVPGIKLLPGATLSLAKSVYTLKWQNEAIVLFEVGEE
jgi:hypothetical protein|tara:strand:+ start:287 stop:457 length:171 start_codon:yes stop_codon:yes gene_type:complete